MARLLAAGTAVALLAGFNEPTPGFSLVSEVGDLISARGRAYHEYRKVRDDSRTLEVKVPKQWDEAAGGSKIVQPSTGERYGTSLVVAPNLDKFRTSFAVAGVRLAASSEPTTSSVNDTLTVNAAKFDEACRGAAPGVKAYDDGRYRGNYRFFTGCAGTKTAAVAVAARSPADGVFILVQAHVRTRADLAAIDRAIRSLRLRKPS